MLTRNPHKSHENWGTKSREGWLEAPRRTPVRRYVFALCMTLLCVLVSAIVERLLPLPNLSLVFLTGVLIVAAVTSFAPALVTAITSFLCYNFFFTEPRYSFGMEDTDEIATVFFFLIMAIIGGNLAGGMRAQVAALQATNEQSHMLLSLNKKLAEAPDMIALYRVAVDAIAEFLHVPICLLAPQLPDEKSEIVAASPRPLALNDKERAAAEQAFKQGAPSGHQTNTLSSVGWRFLPLSLHDACYGVLGFKLSTLPSQVPSEQLLLLDALANQLTLTLARARLVSNLEQARVAEETERLRSSLLSSVSHDLRTPLSSMIGAASTVRELDAQLSPEDKRELLDAVLTEGDA